MSSAWSEVRQFFSTFLAFQVLIQLSWDSTPCYNFPRSVFCTFKRSFAPSSYCSQPPTNNKREKKKKKEWLLIGHGYANEKACMRWIKTTGGTILSNAIPRHFLFWEDTWLGSTTWVTTTEKRTSEELMLRTVDGRQEFISILHAWDVLPNSPP